jgi:hypothetical protein
MGHCKIEMQKIHGPRKLAQIDRFGPGYGVQLPGLCEGGVGVVVGVHA